VSVVKVMYGAELTKVRDSSVVIEGRGRRQEDAPDRGAKGVLYGLSSDDGSRKNFVLTSDSAIRDHQKSKRCACSFALTIR
jgi:hypothetical protein